MRLENEGGLLTYQDDGVNHCYELQRMGGERAKKILQSLLNELSGIEKEDMTTFELGLLRKCATNPPKRYYGAENQINLKIK